MNETLAGPFVARYYTDWGVLAHISLYSVIYKNSLLWS